MKTLKIVMIALILTVFLLPLTSFADTYHLTNKVKFWDDEYGWLWRCEYYSFENRYRQVKIITTTYGCYETIEY